MRYFGGKWRIALWIINYFPEHRIYVEPFGGAGSVLLRKPPSKSDVFNDLDSNVVNLFRVLRNGAMYQELERRLKLTPFSRDEFMQAYEPTDEPVEQARRMMIRAWMGYGGLRGRGRPGFRSNVVAKGHPSVAKTWKEVVDHLPAIVERLRTVTIENRPAVEVIQGHDHPDTLFYVDPPYPLSTRQGSGKTYAHEMSDDDHRALATVLHSVEGKVVISGYPCALYDELYAGWQWVERHASVGGAQGGAQVGPSRDRTEVLWISPNASRPATGTLPMFNEMGL